MQQHTLELPPLPPHTPPGTYTPSTLVFANHPVHVDAHAATQTRAVAATAPSRLPAHIAQFTGLGLTNVPKCPRSDTNPCSRRYHHTRLLGVNPHSTLVFANHPTHVDAHAATPALAAAATILVRGPDTHSRSTLPVVSANHPVHAGAHSATHSRASCLLVT